MSEEEEGSWILDGIVNLLSGPVWSVPILTFIEHKSVTFEGTPMAERGGGGEEEEEEEEKEEEEEEGGGGGGEVEEDHRRIHQEYKKLVDFLLESFMQDLSVTAPQLEEACQRTAISTPFHKSLFEQVWAADDYKTFKLMMIEKNLELQLQALEMLEFKYGITMRESEREKESEGERESEEARREREILEEVYRLSKEQHDQLTSLQDQESRDLEIAVARSIQDEKKRLEKALKRKKEEEEEEEGEEEEEEEEEEEFGRGRVLPPIKPKVDEEDLKRRQEYLKQQRDRLLEMKQKERERRLENFETAEPNRPQSSRAARRAMDGAATIDPNTLAVRRALAARLKAEVIKEAEA